MKCRKTLILMCAVLQTPSLPRAAQPQTGTEILPSWPRPCSVHHDKKAAKLIFETPFYQIEHDLAGGGCLSAIRLEGGSRKNLLAAPMEAMVRDEQNRVFSDANDRQPKFKRVRKGNVEGVEIRAKLFQTNGRPLGLEVKTSYEYHWGYIKVHREFQGALSDTQVREICPLRTSISGDLTDYGYRRGTTEKEGEPAFSFGSCVWGKFATAEVGRPPVKTAFVPRYVMFAAPGVEGFEWFVGSDLQPWEEPLNAGRGHGQFLLQQHPSSSASHPWSISAFYSDFASVPMPARTSFDYYLGIPTKPLHALKPWMHSGFNRNQGQWVSQEQFRTWTAQGIQTLHCHNDGDYAGDGLFWRDGSYPPYPDMDRYDKVISDAHAVGLRVGTYFSNKELHPSTVEFRQHGEEWGRQNAKGELIHNFFQGTNEFGVQMCLRSGWLNFLEFSIDRVLKHHPLDGVYYDWNVALYCCNGLHEGKPRGIRGAGHWDIDELLQLMEWTRQRVGPKGMIILHNTTTPMFATENFADYVVANEWGYGKWDKSGPELSQLPLEWSLVGARARGVISYGQIDAHADRRLHRLFALEALLGGATPWPASPETFDLYRILDPLGNIEQFRFLDWRNRAVILQGNKCASTVYSRPGESWVLVGNMNPEPQRVRCIVDPTKLPNSIKSLTSAHLVNWEAGPDSIRDLDPALLTTSGLDLEIPADRALLLHLQGQ